MFAQFRSYIIPDICVFFKSFGHLSCFFRYFVIFAIPLGVLQATLILLQTQSDKTDTSVIRHKNFKNIFFWVDISCPAKRGEFDPCSITAPSPTSHSACLERAFCVFTLKFSGHAVSGSNGVLSSIIKAQSDGTPVG